MSVWKVDNENELKKSVWDQYEAYDDRIVVLSGISMTKILKYMFLQDLVQIMTVWAFIFIPWIEKLFHVPMIETHRYLIK